MPAIRPEAISNRVRLSYEIRAAIARLVAEDRAVDSVLPAIVDEDSPHEHGIGALSSQHNLLAWTDELIIVAGSAVGVSVSRVVAFIEFGAVNVAVLGQPPDGSHGADPFVGRDESGLQ